jgi:hypothetical protein
VETFSLGIFHMALLRLNRARVQKFTVPWSPAFLFSAGEQGFWYDPSDLSTLFQDAAGSTPVTAVEQPVRLMLDKSGRGNHATASSDAARPVLRQAVTGEYFLVFDGVDDTMAATIPVGQGAYTTMVCALDRGDANLAVSGPRAIASSNANDYIQFTPTTSGRVQLQTRGLSVGQATIGTLSAPNSILVNTFNVLTGITRDDTGVNEHRVNGAASGTSTIASTRPAAQVLGTSQTFTLYRAFTGSANYRLGPYLYINRVLSVSEIELAEQYVASKTEGVTL